MFVTNMKIISSDKTKSVAQLVRETIQMRPSLLDALKMEIVNYSALARMLQAEIGEGSLEAVKAAIIRISEDMMNEKGLQEEKVLSILRKSVVRLQDKIAVITSPEEYASGFSHTLFASPRFATKASRSPSPSTSHIEILLLAALPRFKPLSIN